MMQSPSGSNIQEMNVNCKASVYLSVSIDHLCTLENKYFLMMMAMSSVHSEAVEESECTKNN